MKNLLFDYRTISREDVVLLQGITSETRMSTAYVGLFRRKLIVIDEGAKLRLTTRGRFAVRFLFLNQRVRFTDSYRIDYMRGRTGTIVSVSDSTVDGDGTDEWNYPVKRARPVTDLLVKPDGESEIGLWAVYRPQDVEALDTTGPFTTGMSIDGFFPAVHDPLGVIARKPYER